MKNRVIAILLSAATVGMLAGCGSSGSGTSVSTAEETEAGVSAPSEETASSDTESSGEEKSAYTGDLPEIIWEWPSIGTTGSGFQKVEDALNAKIEPACGAHVTLEPITFSSLASETVLRVSSGEKIDLCLSVGTGVGSLVNSGLIEPLDDYIDTVGADIKETCGDSLAGGYYDGQLYGIPNAYIQAESYGYLARTDLLDKYGITIDPDKLYTLDEIGDIFAKVKEGEGDNFFCMIPEPTSEEPLSRNAFEYDKLGATSASGFLMLDNDFSNTTISNVYETQEYADYAKRMYDWAQAGYISKDAATNTETRESLVGTGNYLGYFSWSTPNVKYSADAQCGYDMTVIKVIDAYTAGDRFQNILWSVPITSSDPELALKVLNYIYQDDSATWLLQYGIEGEDYEVLEQNDEGTKIRYLADDPSTLPYYQPFGVYGNRLDWPLLDPSPIDMNEQLREFNENISAARRSPALGYCFNSDEVSGQYSAVQAVVTQYIPSINSGSVDPTQNLKDFNNDLKAAGIDDVIAANQAQFDEWRANQ